NAIDKFLIKEKIKDERNLSSAALQELCEEFKLILKTDKNYEFPQNPLEILYESTSAVFESWMSERAKIYRKIHKISDSYGTAVTVQAMVFGNMQNDSGSGVVFSRNPNNGEKKIFGEYMMNAQGEDVVSGTKTPLSIAEYMPKELPNIYAELKVVERKLEQHYCDMQDTEFTIENGKLWILQTRTGKRTAQAAIKIAVDLVNEGLIDTETALMAIKPSSLDQLLHPILDPNEKYDVIARGLPASPGATSGIAVFTIDDALHHAKNSNVILIRNETSPEDIAGMNVSAGIITTRGGITSHAAVVTRGMGKPCICGLRDVKIDIAEKTLTTNDNQVIKHGDAITIDGSNGIVVLNEVAKISPQIADHFETFMRWASRKNKLNIRANAENENDVNIAKIFKADGIGLCRTEHMFFSKDRINIVRKMILASDKSTRDCFLVKLEEFQKQDFANIFRIMNAPVTIRLLDPPLHEFLPPLDNKPLLEELAESLSLSFKQIKNRVIDLQESNPMLGHRGCRLGISYPEIYEMQTRAIFSAAEEVNIPQGDNNLLIEIMVPFVMNGREMKLLKAMIDKIASEYDYPNYIVGNMIELPCAALRAGDIAGFSSFFSFGTNDLTQTTLGLSRDDAGHFLNHYKEKEIISGDPFAILDQESVGELIKIGIDRGLAVNPNLKIGVCGEHGGDPTSIEFFADLNIDYISCSPYRVPIARLAAAQHYIKKSKINK
ncbi:MAG: pyruvate, phosphate dikinase, partial [Candidatus Heimdallarchaeota archaeon]|nr:pyruvate, phosphate dikinase [Candidatus Heimdallarchaeota archaeon]